MPMILTEPCLTVPVGIKFEIYRRGHQAFERIPADSEGFVPSEVWGRSFRLVRKPGPVAGTVVYRMESIGPE